MPAKIEADEGFAAGASGTLYQSVRVMEAQSEGFFHKEVLASIDHGRPNLGVELRGRADRNQIDAGIL
jgi:hypothetical protein